jgi:glycosyltransferase involved in cell wall biosynthesis
VATDLNAPRWLCCHLGAREHYAVPRALHRNHRLELLITDAWAPPESVWRRLPGQPARRLSERYHHELASAPIRAFTPSLVAREMVWRSREGGWDTLIRRNKWFGGRATTALAGVSDDVDGPTVVFAHSYCAREVFTYARSRGWTTVLGQIDPGPEHFRLLRTLAERHAEYGPAPSAPPQRYFDDWREECRLADWIVVNSEWSREALVRAGIPREKLRVVPLPFELEVAAPAAAREYPNAFTQHRPLRALFVGHATVAKGVPALLEAMAGLAEVPIELTLVGGVAMTVPERFRNHPSIRWVGAVPRLEVMRYYRDSDVLLFPSLSDGFGMAQIEAQGCGLPIIASRSCGCVVVDGSNGMLLAEVTPNAISDALRACAADPSRLREFARRSATHGGLASFGSAMLHLERASPTAA